MVMPAVGLLTVVPIVAILGLRALGLAHAAGDLWMVAGLALASAALVGLPALRWAIERERTGLVHLAVIGAVVGIVPPVLMLLSGTIGQLSLGGGDYTRWVLSHGPSLPWFGVMRWSSYSVLVGECAGIGAISGSIMRAFF
ncbi:MAG TPA: hypothetical protein VJN96_16195 [Vicinamibacterales bacterium]|nr:hypothetical protein [Vicinamibacterales bacterium]